MWHLMDAAWSFTPTSASDVIAELLLFRFKWSACTARFVIAKGFSPPRYVPSTRWRVNLFARSATRTTGLPSEVDLFLCSLPQGLARTSPALLAAARWLHRSPRLLGRSWSRPIYIARFVAYILVVFACTSFWRCPSSFVLPLVRCMDST